MFVPPSRSVSRPVLTSAVVAALTASCGPGVAVGTSPYDRTVDALCQARATDDVAVARIAFDSGAHAQLHELATQVIEVDRGTAADLLTSKNRVESALREQAPADQLHPIIDDLLREVRRSLDTLDLPAPAC